jgi:hypothetical protein
MSSPKGGAPVMGSSLLVSRRDTMNEPTVKVTYLGKLTGNAYRHTEYSLEAGEEYEMPASEGQRLLKDFGPAHFTVVGLSTLPVDPENASEGKPEVSKAQSKVSSQPKNKK